MKTIKFKSTPENWKKEYLGIKSNTIRKFDTLSSELMDVREEALYEFATGKRNLLTVEIEHTETKECFQRIVKDVTIFESFYIISW